MELLFLCTILMALVSYVSMALAKPPSTLIANHNDIIVFGKDTVLGPSEANIIEFQKDSISLASA